MSDEGVKVVSGAAGLPSGPFLVRYRKAGLVWSTDDSRGAANIEDARRQAAELNASGFETQIIDPGGNMVK